MTPASSNSSVCHGSFSATTATGEHLGSVIHCVLTNLVISSLPTPPSFQTCPASVLKHLIFCRNASTNNSRRPCVLTCSALALPSGISCCIKPPPAALTLHLLSLNSSVALPLTQCSHLGSACATAGMTAKAVTASSGVRLIMSLRYMFRLLLIDRPSARLDRRLCGRLALERSTCQCGCSRAGGLLLCGLIERLRPAQSLLRYARRGRGCRGPLRSASLHCAPNCRRAQNRIVTAS